MHKTNGPISNKSTRILARWTVQYCSQPAYPNQAAAAKTRRPGNVSFTNANRDGSRRKHPGDGNTPSRMTDEKVQYPKESAPDLIVEDRDDGREHGNERRDQEQLP
jgi:hypothetical protein